MAFVKIWNVGCLFFFLKFFECLNLYRLITLILNYEGGCFLWIVIMMPSFFLIVRLVVPPDCNCFEHLD